MPRFRRPAVNPLCRRHFDLTPVRSTRTTKTLRIPPPGKMMLCKAWIMTLTDAESPASNGGAVSGGTKTSIADAGDPTDELCTRISLLAETVFAAGDVTATLAQVVNLAAESLEGCDHAGAFVTEGNRITAPAATDPIAAGLDALQLRLGEGPCLDVIARGGAVYADDLADVSPWPAWATGAVHAGVRSVLAVAVRGGALNCYGVYPQAFGIIDRGKAQVLATLAGLALTTAEGRQVAETRAGNLELALGTRELIGQAEGILMERERISSDQAFDILRRSSQHLNIKLRDVAQRLVDTGLDPEGQT